jgi:hypothetical protein
MVIKVSEELVTSTFRLEDIGSAKTMTGDLREPNVGNDLPDYTGSHSR